MRCTNVFQTQVISWLHEFRKNDIDFVLIKMKHVKYLFKSKEYKDYKKAKQMYDGKTKIMYFLPTKLSISIFFIALQFLIPNLIHLLKREKIIIQTRDDSFWNALKLLKKVAPSRIFIIYDSRAANTEEYKFSHSIRKMNPKEEKKFIEIEKREMSMVDISDKVFCVSNVLIQYHKNKAKINGEKFFLYPCSSDREKFYFSDSYRKILRGHFGWGNKIVMVYSGGLLMPWHLVDQMFSLFKEIHEINKEFQFLILSNDIHIAYKKQKEFDISDSVMHVLTVKNSDVHQYLSSCDLGLLLREDVPMNNVASPSKFSEYLMCGLPVVISPRIGDFSDFIENNKIGYVLNFPYNPEAVVRDLKKIVTGSNKETISKLGNEHFSKQARMESIINQYKMIGQ